MSIDPSYEIKILEEKTDKFGFRLIIVCTLMSVIFLTSGFFVYINLQKEIDKSAKEKSELFNQLSNKVENKIFNISSKADSLKNKLNKYEIKFKSSLNLMDHLKTDYTDKFNSIQSEIEKDVKKDIVKIYQNRELIRSLGKELNKKTDAITKLRKNLAGLNKNLNKKMSVIRISGKKQRSQIFSKLKELQKNQGFLTKRLDKLQENNKRIADIKLLINKLAALSEKNKKDIDQIFIELKKNQIEMRKVNEKIDQKLLRKRSNSDLIEQDLNK